MPGSQTPGSTTPCKAMTLGAEAAAGDQHRNDNLSRPAAPAQQRGLGSEWARTTGSAGLRPQALKTARPQQTHSRPSSGSCDKRWPPWPLASSRQLPNSSRVPQRPQHNQHQHQRSSPRQHLQAERGHRHRPPAGSQQAVGGHRHPLPAEKRRAVRGHRHRLPEGSFSLADCSGESARYHCSA